MSLLEQGKSDAQIGRALNTTADSVNLYRKRHGIPARSTLLWSAREVAQRLGIGCAKTITRWIEKKWLKGRPGQAWGPYRQWYVKREAVMDFLASPEHFHRWDADRITDDFLRHYAKRARGNVRFLTVGEAAERMCVQVNTIGQWIRKGWIPAVRNGNHLIRESDLDAFERRQIGGHRKAA